MQIPSVPVPVHAALDATSVAALVIAGAGRKDGLRLPLVASAAAIAAFSLATKYSADRVRPITMRTHRRLDQAIGLGFLAGAAYARQPASVRLALAAFGAFSVAAASLTPDRPVPSTRQLGLARTAVVPHRRSLMSAEVAHGVAYQRLGIVNVAFLGEPGGPWVLVDAGLKGTERLIRAAAKERFGSVPPDAIILTHGHFDHVGALRSLAEEWDVPIYAHADEFPYLTGVASYPPADPDAGGGLVTALSPFYPTAPIDITDRLRALPENGALPGAPDWR